MDCIEYLKGKFAGVSEEDIVSIMEEVKKERAALEKKIGSVDDLEQQLLQKLQGKVDNAVIAAQAQKRATALQLTKRLEAFDFVTQTFAGRETEGLSALLVGTNRIKAGARKSVDAAQTSLTGYYTGGLLADLQSLGNTHVKLLAKGAMDEDISRAMWSIDNSAAGEFKGPKEAMDIAQVIHKWQEKARDDANRAGAWIGKEPGYIVRQSHDRERIERAGFQKWSEEIAPKLDWDRTGQGNLLTAEDRNKFLLEVYKNLTMGRIREAGGSDLSSNFSQARIGSRAKKLSSERVLHFKSGEDWFAYNQKFGMRNLREAVVDGLSQSAHSTALMRILGPSPDSNFEQLQLMVERAMHNAGDAKGIKKLHNARNRFKNQLKEVDGTLNYDAVPWLASVGRNLRALTSMAKLGGAVISGISDAPVFSSEMAYQGRGFFRSLVEGITDLTHGRGTVEQRKILSQLGVFFEGMCGDITARFSGDETPGVMTRMQNTFFRLNCLTWWTDSWRRVAGLMMAHDLALEKDLDWGGLTMERQRVLSLYDIGADEWEVYRQGKLRAADGRDYMTPEVVNDVSDDVIAAYLEKKGIEASAIRIEDTRADLEDRLRTYFRDRINFAVLEPDAKTRSILRQGTSAGTVSGEAIRFATQFKSFPIAYAQKVLGRQIYGMEGSSRGEAIRSFTRLILMSTLFGYGAMTIKDLLKGKTPRDPADPRTWVSAFTQGGGAGIFGDFLFGEYSRFGGSLAATLAGPTAGTISDLANIYARVRDGDSAAQATLRFVMNNVPGNGLWYFRGPFDYLIGYELFEMMNPGYFNRMKRRVERENNQTFWASPVQW